MASLPDFTAGFGTSTGGFASSPQVLLTLGMFVFGMDTAAYSDFSRRIGWRHGKTERHGVRAASQFLGPGDDVVTLAGRLVPEIAGRYAALESLIEMADTGEDWPLIDGMGRVLGQFAINQFDQDHVAVMGGGLPRAIDFTLELERKD